MARRKTQATEPVTTAQRLSSIVKSCRDIMRKDKGLSGDLDRLPMLTWIMFLKFLDDMERIREQEAVMKSERFRPAIEPPYRWRDWAAREDGITGEELISFVNNEEAVRPDGTRGPGLFAYLRSLQGADGGDRRDVIATVFKGTINRMITGYLLRDVINKVNGIHFDASEDIHTLSHLYESMLRQMRDAAGDSGEFYTPRPVVKFMVAVTNPKLGETLLDPACGTGGFLVESFQHLEKQCKTVENRRIVQRESIFGQDAKPLPYLLAQMNLLLHGLEYPQVSYGNSLAVRITEIGDKDRVDVILTNPPFGGEEESSIKNNFPADMQTSETALLFLQLIMRKLKRPQKNEGKPGRAAVVVPNGTLFGDGVCARIKEELLHNFNLHTIVSSHYFLFAVNHEKLEERFLGYWVKTPFFRDQVSARGSTNYAAIRPHHVLDYSIPLPPLAEQRRIVAKIERLAGKIEEARRLSNDVERSSSAILQGIFQEITERAARLPLSDVAPLVRRPVTVRVEETYPELGIRSFGKGAFHKPALSGLEVGNKRLFWIEPGDLLFNNVFAWEGAVAVARGQDAGRVGSHRFIARVPDPCRATAWFLWFYFLTEQGLRKLGDASPGGAGRNRTLGLGKLDAIEVPVPPLDRQRWFDSLQAKRDRMRTIQAQTTAELDALLPAVLERAFREQL